MCEPSRSGTSVIEDDSLDWLKELPLVEPYLEEAHFEEFCCDIVMGSATHSTELINSIYTEPLDLVPILSPLLFITPSHLHAFHESPRDISGSQPSFDPYCA